MPGAGRASLTERCSVAARQREAAQAQRRRRMVEPLDGARVRVDGRVLANFSGNDYLGLAQHLDVVAALQEAAALGGVGSTGSAAVCGHQPAHAAFEQAMAEHCGYPRALLFGSGYLANLGVLQALLGPGDVCLQDKLNHACLLDGARLSGAELKRYPHADIGGAARQLQSRPNAAALVATDGLFSMDGDFAPLKDLAVLARAENALLYVDDAHGFGITGPQGRGSVAHAGLGPREVPLQLVTLGKALGGYGAVLLGQDALVEHIEQEARSLRYSTALPAPLAAAALAALRVMQREGWRRLKLAALVARFRRGAQQLGLRLLESTSPIQPLLLGNNARTLAVAQALEARGYLVGAIRPPTVPAGSGRLRITLSALHDEAMVDGLLGALDAIRTGTRAG